MRVLLDHGVEPRQPPDVEEPLVHYCCFPIKEIEQYIEHQDDGVVSDYLEQRSIVVKELFKRGLDPNQRWREDLWLDGAGDRWRGVELTPFMRVCLRLGYSHERDMTPEEYPRFRFLQHMARVFIDTQPSWVADIHMVRGKAWTPLMILISAVDRWDPDDMEPLEESVQLLLQAGARMDYPSLESSPLSGLCERIIDHYPGYGPCENPAGGYRACVKLLDQMINKRLCPDSVVQADHLATMASHLFEAREWAALGIVLSRLIEQDMQPLSRSTKSVFRTIGRWVDRFVPRPRYIHDHGIDRILDLFQNSKTLLILGT